MVSLGRGEDALAARGKPLAKMTGTSLCGEVARAGKDNPDQLTCGG